VVVSDGARAVDGADGAEGVVVAALVKTRRRIGTLLALRVLVLLEVTTFIKGSRLPSLVVL
jgi:hypothetical protein